MLRCSATIGRLQKCWSRSVHKRVTSVSKLWRFNILRTFGLFVRSFVRLSRIRSKLTRKRFEVIDVKFFMIIQFHDERSVFIIYIKVFIYPYFSHYKHIIFSFLYVFLFLFLMDESEKGQIYHFWICFLPIGFFFSLCRDKW